MQIFCLKQLKWLMKCPKMWLNFWHFFPKPANINLIIFLWQQIMEKITIFFISAYPDFWGNKHKICKDSPNTHSWYTVNWSFQLRLTHIVLEYLLFKSTGHLWRLDLNKRQTIEFWRRVLDLKWSVMNRNTEDWGYYCLF